MRTLRLFLVHLSPVTRAVVRAAARKAFPTAEIVEVGTLAEVGPAGRAYRSELLVLVEPDAVSAAQAVQVVDASGFARWAVVLLGGDSADLAETVPPEEWQPALLARVFRSAVAQHELGRENLRLQGDLKTVARRIRHDLGAPIGCIGASSHVVRVSLAPAALRSVVEMVQNIEDSSAEISEIVDRVSFLLRASADPEPPAPVAMAAVVAEVLRQLEPEIQKAGAEVTCPASWPEASGVARWLHVIWWNLLQNALRHGGPAARVRLAWTPDGEGYRFTVADRGAVLEPYALAGLFRPFDQLHLLPAPGLGLSIVQRLVALQGGRCGYERLEEGASVFFFTLPGGKAGHHSGPAGSRIRRRQSPSDVEPVSGGG